MQTTTTHDTTRDIHTDRQSIRDLRGALDVAQDTLNDCRAALHMAQDRLENAEAVRDRTKAALIAAVNTLLVQQFGFGLTTLALISVDSESPLS